MDLLKVLITVKTYPIPSAKYDELVCTAGVTEAGEFVRLYPINFRELPFSQQYKKYQWIEVSAEKHGLRDVRKESYRPDCETLEILGEPIPTKPGGDWSDRARYALAKRACSMEELNERRRADRTSLGIFRPKKVNDLVIAQDDAEWNPRFLEALRQQRLWDDRSITKQPPRKIPFKFQYKFECDDKRCNRNHKISIVDWEVGALYWRLVDDGASSDEAANKVRDKFLKELCSPSRDTHFFVGTTKDHPASWLILGVFFPTIEAKKAQIQLDLPFADGESGL